MRKTYVTPDAQVIMLAPCEEIAWSNNSSWKTGGLFWKQKDYMTETPASGTPMWYDFVLDEIE